MSYGRRPEFSIGASEGPGVNVGLTHEKEMDAYSIYYVVSRIGWQRLQACYSLIYRVEPL